MTGKVHQYLGRFDIIECCSCHMHFGVPPEFKQEKLDKRNIQDQRTFYCPQGHAQWYAGETAEDKLRRENERLTQNRAFLEDQIRAEREKKDAARRQTRAFKGVITRTKNRVGAGVCPCCNRSFTSLARHMAAKHPKYRKEEVA